MTGWVKELLPYTAGLRELRLFNRLNSGLSG